MPGRLIMNFRTLVGQVPNAIFLFAKLVDTAVEPNLMVSLLFAGISDLDS
jgi:hypothetical protein